MSKRIEQLKSWLEKLDTKIETFEVASNDASFRGYFRVVFSNSENKEIITNTPYIVMDAPPDFEDVKPFIRIALFLKKHNLNVPRIYASNEVEGFLLLEDFGNQNFLDNLNSNNADSLYKKAMDALVKLQSIKKEQHIKLPYYDSELLIKEMDLFKQWYVNVHLKQVLTHSQSKVLQDTIEHLKTQVLRHPQVIVHRDYHSRNLMLVEDKTKNPGIIDFQDAVIGSCTYDLVSLLRDSYISWPEQQVEKWVSYFHQQLIDSKIIENCSFETFMQWFDFMGMQRQIKVVGIFARLYHRDGKENYLKDIPLTYSNLKITANKYPQFKEFSELLDYLILKK